MTERVEAVVIGAGVVGLAIARALALSGREVIVLEKNARVGEETSSRNSEVIHAGIYYRPGSFKARLCVSGKRQLYRYCADKGIPHRRCGKLIVAPREDRLTELRVLQAQAIANGVGDLEWLAQEHVTAREPSVHAIAALWSPSTGILDSHALMLALQGDLEAAGGSVALFSKLASASLGGDRMRLRVASDDRESELETATLINCAGLHATRVARALEGLEPRDIPATRYAKGSYFVYDGPSPFRHLIYPLPQPGGLGVHATLDLAGRTRFGPDVEWVDSIDYSIDPERERAFYPAIRAYWPGLPDGSLSPGYVGVRPKVVGPGAPAGDFLIHGPERHGVRGLVNLFGIESPGLTSALAIAEHVAGLLGRA